MQREFPVRRACSRVSRLVQREFSDARVRSRARSLSLVRTIALAPRVRSRARSLRASRIGRRCALAKRWLRVARRDACRQRCSDTPWPRRLSGNLLFMFTFMVAKSVVHNLTLHPKIHQALPRKRVSSC